MSLGDLASRYLEPARMLLANPRAVLGIAQCLWACYRSTGRSTPRPPAIVVDVSDACNLACAHCSRTVKRDARRSILLDVVKFRSLVHQVRPLYLLLSGYGETMLHPRLPEMVRHASSLGSAVTLVTNGTLLDGVRVRHLLEAGLAKFKVSMDAADGPLYARLREGAALDEVLEGVERVLRMRGRGLRPLVEVQMVIHRENADQVAAMVTLCRERLLSVQPNFLLMFTYGGQEEFEKRVLPRGHAGVLDEIRRARAASTSAGFARSVGSLDVARDQLTRDLSASPCYVPWYSCLVSTDGELYPCCHHSIHGRSIGNVFAQPFAEVWNGPRMQEFRRNLCRNRTADPVCRNCQHEDGPLHAIFSMLACIPGLAGLSGRFRRRADRP